MKIKRSIKKFICTSILISTMFISIGCNSIKLNEERLINAIDTKVNEAIQSEEVGNITNRSYTVKQLNNGETIVILEGLYNYLEHTDLSFIFYVNIEENTINRIISNGLGSGHEISENKCFYYGDMIIKRDTFWEDLNY